MKRKGIFSGLLCLSITAYLLFMPGYIRQGRGEDFCLANLLTKKPVSVGTITLYHVASVKTYQGSVTAYLTERAESFQKLHPGVHIEVEGMSEKDYLERLAYGRFPDMLSFFAGTAYEELLQSCAFEDLPSLRQGLSASAYAVPYFFSGYVLSSLSGDFSGLSASVSEEKPL